MLSVTQIDEFGQLGLSLSSETYLSVAILENGRHLGFSSGQSDGMDLITLEMSGGNFGACITIYTIHHNNLNSLLHCRSVTPMPMLQLAPTSSRLQNV